MRAVFTRLRGLLVPVLFVALAALFTSSYGSGTMLNDGQAGLHIDPLRFLTRLFYAWNPALYLGTHTGYWFPYEMPYAWLYGIAQYLHVSQELAQRLAVFAVYLGCLASMYYCLRSVAPRLHPVARIAGSCAYLFNLYVALNSQAQIVWLLTYGVLPAIVGIIARVLRREMNVWRAALGIALLVLVGGGVNPPLVGINVIVLAIFAIVMVAFDRNPGGAARRIVPFVVVASIATVAINLYWLVPFGDYFRNVWLGGVLSESASMHNADTSFSNVLRGLGHWATFSGFDGRPYFPWAAAYASGFFSAFVWLVPILALGGFAFRKNQRPLTLYFLLVAIVSVPLVVGYYHDVLGDAITTPVYDVLYRKLPGFQMFRFSYKWVAGVEFAICALYAFSVDGILTRLRRMRPRLRAMRWGLPAAATALVVLPIAILVPVLQAKTNYPGPVLPNWEYREGALLGNDQRQRVALFPTQFLEQFDWGAPQFYIEDSFVNRPMLYGLLGAEPQEGTDQWLRGAYRATREGRPSAADYFRVLGVDTILQRDDFIPAIDFSFPEQWEFNDTTLTHDLLYRVLGARPVRSYGPLRVYHLAGALPLVYGVMHPHVVSFPAFSDAYLGDVRAMAKGEAEFRLPPHLPHDVVETLKALSPIVPQAAGQTQDLAVEQALAGGGIRVHPPSADVTSTAPFTVKSPGQYVVFAHEQSILGYRPAHTSLEIDSTELTRQTAGSAWAQYGEVALTAGDHLVSTGYPDPDLIVALVKKADLVRWTARLRALQRSLANNLSSTWFVNAAQMRVTIPHSGTYRVHASARTASVPDHLVPATLRRKPRESAGFFASTASLRYVPGDGVGGTDQLRLPQAWYRKDPTAYRWGRGDPEPWLLFTRDAHVHVFLPAGRNVSARVSLRISRLQVLPVMYVAVDGRLQRRVVLPGPGANAQAYDGPGLLAGPLPQRIVFDLTLHPGWNDVAFRFDPLAGETAEFGDDVVAAGVAPDLSFRPTAAPNGSSGPAPSRDDAFGVHALSLPPEGLRGDPDLQGNVVGTGKGIWLAAAISSRGRSVYRVFPIGADGYFYSNFVRAFPNGWNDDADRIEGIWFVFRGAHPAFSRLYYGVHAMLTKAEHRSLPERELALRVDGKRIGARPVVLAAGRHLVTSAVAGLTIGRLTIDPANLPKARPFALSWTRSSPVSLDVRVPDASRPFLLVFGEAFHPEWRASLDGKPLTHVIVDGVANGWIVPAFAGKDHKVVLSFAGQRYYVISAAISLVALILLALLAYATPLGRGRARR